MTSLMPPIANKRDHKITYHSKEFNDEYFWLRNKESIEVLDYLKSENDYFDQNMKPNDSLVKELFNELISRTKEDDESVPEKFGPYYYYHRIEKGKNYRIYCRKKESLDAKEEVILDLNKLAEGRKYLHLGSFDISNDHTYIAYLLDFQGYENYELFVKDLETNEEKKLQTSNLYEQIFWGRDNNTLYYCKRDKINRSSSLYKGSFTFTIGNDIMINEELLYYEHDEIYFITLKKSKDNNYIFITSLSKETTEVRFLDLQTNKLQLFAKRKFSVIYYLDYHEKYFYILTNENAINFKVLRVKRDLFLNLVKWEEFIQTSKDQMIESLEMFENHIVMYNRKKGLKNISIYAVETKIWHDIQLPEELYAINYRGGPNNYEYKTQTLRFYYESLKTPKCVYDYDMNKRSLNLKKKDEIANFNPNDYVMKREFVTVRDGIKVPISILHPINIVKDGRNPTYLYGYGSYGLSIEPSFNTNVLSLVKRGFIYVVAHIRGGEEMGRLWYLNGKYMNKKNTFNDFIDVATYLVKEKYTNPDKLAIYGRSAGGLLIGSVINIAPDLFKVATTEVPFVDVINTMMDASIPLTTFEYEEWGDPNKKEFFDYMLSYSPYDNVKAQRYPHLLITAGLNDPRVAYWEPAKFVARLRSLKTDSNDLLFKVNMGAGHTGSSGKYEALKEIAYEYAFILTRI